MNYLCCDIFIVILEYMEPWEQIHSLRLVCRTMHSLVHSPENIKKLYCSKTLSVEINRTYHRIKYPWITSAFVNPFREIMYLATLLSSCPGDVYFKFALKSLRDVTDQYQLAVEYKNFLKNCINNINKLLSVNIDLHLFHNTIGLPSKYTKINYDTMSREIISLFNNVIVHKITVQMMPPTPLGVNFYLFVSNHATNPSFRVGRNLDGWNPKVETLIGEFRKFSKIEYSGQWQTIKLSC